MAKQILLLGGHGKVSLLMTPMLLSRSWNVTSVIRNPEQREAILEQGHGQPGKLDVLISSLDDVKTDAQAQSVIDQVKPDWVVWSAGAGGKGGPDRTYAIDRDAAKHYIAASVRTLSVTKFLMVSYNSNRRTRAAWWSDDDYAAAQKMNNETLPHYHLAKMDADEYLTALATQRGSGFEAIVLRPGTLSADPLQGKVSLGKIGVKGAISRADVADVGARLLDSSYSGWVDLLGGDEPTEEAVARVVRDHVDTVEGEDVEGWVKKHKL